MNVSLEKFVPNFELETEGLVPRYPFGSQFFMSLGLNRSSGLENSESPTGASKEKHADDKVSEYIASSGFSTSDDFVVLQHFASSGSFGASLPCPLRDP